MNTENYIELLEQGLYEDLFDSFTSSVNEISNISEKRKHIKSFFDNVFSYQIFDDLFEKDEFSKFNKVFLEHFKQDEFYKSVGIQDKIDMYLDKEKIQACFSVAVVNGQYENAKLLLPFFDKELSIFTNTITQIQDTNNLEGLNFLCNNMNNIHFSDGELLRTSANMSPTALRMLIDDFKFDINETSSQNSFNLIHLLIAKDNTKNFSFIIDNYSDNINLAQIIKGNGSIKNIFDLIDKSNHKFEFLSKLLDIDNTDIVKSTHIERIGQTLFNPTNISTLSTTDIYDKFFSHPSFDHQSFNLGQGYFLYGILSKIGEVANTIKDEEVTKNYVRILDSYLKHTNLDSIPDSPKLHIVGAAIHVAKMSSQNITTDACMMVVRKFNSYLNKPNPSGILPLAQVEPDTVLYRLLINHGAISPEPDPSFFKGVLNYFGRNKNKKELNTNLPVIEAAPKTNSLASLRVVIREDFKEMHKSLSNPDTDIEIKMKCENMFLKSDKFIKILEKNNLASFYDEVHFLSQNFSNYLKKSLNSYATLLVSTKDFSAGAEEKIKKAKDLCMTHVNLLDNQIDLIIENVQGEITDSALSDLKVRGRFLNEKFDTRPTIEQIIAKPKTSETDSNLIDENIISVVSEQQAIKKNKP